MDAPDDLPAVAGGKPAKTSPFRKSKRYGEEELAQLRETIDQQTLFYAQGKKVKALEEAMARAHGVKHAIASNSCTTAIHSALIAAGISPGDEVIVTPVTDMGSILPILWQNAVPVFADLDPHTYNISPPSVLERITAQTKAILAVHLAGNACDLKALKDLCDARHITLIEDAAQSWGCEYDGKPIGSIGAMGCFSFNEFKHISTGDGGMVITDDDALAKKLRLATDKCFDRSAGLSVQQRQATFLANNYRMTELQGAVGLAQFAKLPGIVSRLRAWCGKLHEGLKGIPGLARPAITEKCNPSWWFYMFRIEPEKMGCDANTFVKAMKAEGIALGAHYIADPVYTYPLFENHSAFDHASHLFSSRQYRRGLCPQAESILETCVMLHVNDGYTDDDLAQTLKAFKRVTNWFHKGNASP